MFRIVVILLALLFDIKLGDPPNTLHPLLLMGRWLSFGRRLLVEDSKLTIRSDFWFGTFWTLLGIGMFVFPLQLLNNRSKKQLVQAGPKTTGFPFLSTLLHAVLLKPVFAYRGLRKAAKTVACALENNDLAEARRLLSWHLVSRDTGDLNANEVAGATIESLAENITDSVTAPLLAYAAGGLPAAWAYRFVNTADAMWGYRTPELEQLGKFPARLDDALNWLPARLTGWLLVVSAWLGRAEARQAARTMLAQHHRTPSPNAGWTMSAMAGALHITLTKRDTYELVGGQAELTPQTIKRALQLTDITVVLTIILICSSLAIGYAVKLFRIRSNQT
jgi:adenosylcobinamide-phosphate synthase